MSLIKSQAITDSKHSYSAFVHKKDCGGIDLTVGQTVSFVFEQGAKGVNAKQVQIEEVSGAAPFTEEEEDEGERVQGRIKSYNEEKGCAFVVSQAAASNDVLFHTCSRGCSVVFSLSRHQQPCIYLSTAST